MKYCSNCGTQNQDETLFCENCGNKFEVDAAQPAPENPYYTQPAPAAPVEPVAQPTYRQYNPYGGQPITQPAGYPGADAGQSASMLKTALQNPLFLTAVILFSVNILISIIYAVIPTNVEAIFALFPADLRRELASSIDYSAVNAGAVFGALLGSIPSVLMCIGFWQMYTSAKSPMDKPLGGMGLVKAALIINMICVIVAFVFLSIVLFVMMALADIVAAAIVVLIVGIIVIIPAIVLGIIFYVKAIGSVTTLQQTASPLGNPMPKKLSSFVAVFNCIGAFFLFINAFSLLVFNPLGFISGLVSAAYLVLISVCIFNYNSALSRRLLTKPMQGDTTPRY